MKSYKLKDAGKDPFRVDALAKWIGFGAVDDSGHGIEVRVEDSALQRLDPSSGGADHTHVLVAHRDKIFKIAAEKYELGRESGDIIWVTVADVAQPLAG
jgi:hypothetical protein